MSPANQRDQLTIALRPRVLNTPPGAFFGAAPVLANELGVGPSTVRAALLPLVTEGLLEVRTGSGDGRHGGGGYYRRKPLLVRRLASDRLSRARRMAGVGAVASDAQEVDWRSESLGIEELEPPVPVAEILGQDLALVRKRRIWMGDQIVQLHADSWLPLDLVEAAPRIRDEDPGPGGIYGRIEDAGFRLGEFTEQLQARHASPAEVELLGDGPPTVVDLTRTAWTTNGRPVEVMVSTVRAESFLFTYRFPAE